MSGLTRFFRAIGYYISFKFLWAAESLESHPGVIKAGYEDVISEKKRRLNQLANSVARIVSVHEQKKHSLEELISTIEENEQEKEGAVALLRERASQLKQEGKSVQEIEEDSEYQEWAAAYNDISSTLKEQHERAEELETDLQNLTSEVKDYEMEIKRIQRDVEKLGQEKVEAVAEVTLAQQMEASNKALAGIGEDRTEETLMNLRQRRSDATARAKVAKTLSGADITAQRRKLREAAQKRVNNIELRELAGLTDAAADTDASKTTTPPESVQDNLPE